MPSHPADITRITDLLRGNLRGMSVGEIADAIGINRNTAARYLDMLLVAGRVEMRTFGKAKVYFLSQRVPISALLNISSALVMVLDHDGRIIVANDQILSFCGTVHEDTIGKKLEETELIFFSHPLLEDYINNVHNQVESNEEIRLLREGRDYYFRQKIIRSVFDDGSPGITIIIEEITNQKKAEEALRQSEEMFRTLVSDICDVIWAADQTGAITYISPRSESVCGIPPDDMIGHRFTDFMDTEEKMLFKRAIQPSIQAQKAWPLVDCNIKRPDGELIAVELSGNPITIPDADGQPLLLGYRGAFRNVTERNRAVKHVRQWRDFLNSIVENIPDMVAVEELENHTLIFFNQAAEDFIGFPREFLIGQKPDKIFPEEYAALWSRTTQEIEDSLESLEVIHPFCRGEGSETRILRTKKIPIFSSKGQLRNVLAITTDVTGEKPIDDRIYDHRW
ncbi:MAG: PAS domain S-box protein [Methanocalculus sp. MSAO_Arc2]|uniref:PAS domain S-box protein n=1 Tax=Methanocalculus sp. MSAO_Arc2 TaxID=2293855 RepID=UPI000FF269A2|nr:MAG: PAS domain S-box protein [Methanocalculus sp. MSAO_Arc2]